MMYILCPTCNHPLADKQILYTEFMAHLCGDLDNNNITQNQADKLKEEFINSLALKRYCCKMRIITFRELVKIVK